MVDVIIKTESHYTVNRKRIREIIEKILKAQGVKGKVEVSVSIIGDRLMRKLNCQYRHLDEVTSVLSFPLSLNTKEHHFVDPPDGILRLGDIVISYPQARERAIEEERLVDDEIDELVEHGLLHLLGQHND